MRSPPAGEPVCEALHELVEAGVLSQGVYFPDVVADDRERISGCWTGALLPKPGGGEGRAVPWCWR